MRAGARLALRLATPVAFGATAALAVILGRGVPVNTTLASARAPGSQRPAVTPRCAAAELRISVGEAAHLTAKITRYALDFTNVSGTPCTLVGYPEVAAYRGDHVQVGELAAHDTSVAASRILLAPGETAHASLDASLSPARCRPVRAAGLRVVIGGQSAASYVRRPILACASQDAGGQDYLRVRAIQRGAGAEPE